MMQRILSAFMQVLLKGLDDVEATERRELQHYTKQNGDENIEARSSVRS